jgi:hypothetical protein
MVWRIGQFYARRVVNVNVNVIVAGVLAGVIGLLFVSLTRYFPFFNTHRGWIVATGAICDIIADVTIYYILHWVANHWSMLKWARLHVPPVMGEQSFFRSATLVQFERAMLSPIYYGAFATVNYLLLHVNLPREVAFAAGLLSGLSSTRVLHTLWMLRADRKCRLAAQCPTEETHLTPGTPTETLSHPTESNRDPDPPRDNHADGADNGGPTEPKVRGNAHNVPGAPRTPSQPPRTIRR